METLKISLLIRPVFGIFFKMILTKKIMLKELWSIEHKN